MQPWQARVVEEEQALRVKLDALNEFVDSDKPAFEHLPWRDRHLLIR